MPVLTSGCYSGGTGANPYPLVIKTVALVPYVTPGSHSTGMTVNITPRDHSSRSVQ